mgnify:CR=1 FL=1
MIDEIFAELYAAPDLWRPRTLNRNEFLSRAGEVDHNVYYVEEGAIRIFHITDHDEHTFRFGYRGSQITSQRSFYRGGPSE